MSTLSIYGLTTGDHPFKLILGELIRYGVRLGVKVEGNVYYGREILALPLRKRPLNAHHPSV
jgi:hypothetical protein